MYVANHALSTEVYAKGKTAVLLLQSREERREKGKARLENPFPSANERSFGKIG
jgi:hypothetical protein